MVYVFDLSEEFGTSEEPALLACLCL